MKMTRMLLCMLLGSMLLVGGMGRVAIAQNDLSSGVGRVDASSLRLYGQFLDIGGVYQPKGSLTWDQLMPKIVEVLPESQEKSMSAADLCDHMSLLYGLYSRDNKSEIQELAEEFEAIKPLTDKDAKSDGGMHPYFGAISSRLMSSSNAGVVKLIESFPESYNVRIFALRRSVTSELLISHVHDAALLKCSDHAKLKGYEPAWLP